MMLMKDWVINNTKITLEQYEKVINNNSEDKTFFIADNFRARLLYIIMCFTLEKPTEERLKAFEMERKNGYYNFHDISFKLFYEMISDPILFSLERYGNCHFDSVILSKTVHCDVITAICRDYKNYPFLHSFIVIKNTNGDEFIGDSSLNIIMKKDLYYALLDVHELTRISESELKELIDIITRNRELVDIDYREMLCFPNEIKEGILKLERTLR